jgi:hypothetical protein
MTKTEAFELRDKILEMCRAKNQWVAITEERKPDVRMVKLEVSIKIDQ